MRVLLVEDDASTAMAIELMMKSEGFNVYTTDFGEDGVDLAKTYDYDVILLDLGLPDISGLEVLRQVRAAKIATPVIIVTGDTRIDTKVKAFSAGADDFLAKPFHKDELVSRARAVIRRSKGHSVAVVQVGDLSVNLDAKVASAFGKPLHLTGKEYGILELLALRRGMTITKEMCLNHLYGGMDEPEVKIVDVFVCKLRKKFRAAGLGEVIETVWGRGYVLGLPNTPTQPSAVPAVALAAQGNAS